MGISNNRNLMPVVFLLFILFCCPLVILSSIQDGEALLQFKKSLGDPDALHTWVPKTSPCMDKNKRWGHVLCGNNGNVSAIGLNHLKLSGKVDMDALSKLPDLRTISLIGNDFSGPIPEFHRLVLLKALYLSDNKFSGPIPPDYFSKLNALKKLWLNNNQFSEDIPPSVAQLKFLQELHLENNNFTGKIPPDLKQPPLLDLNLSNNQLQGEIPASLSMFNESSFAGNPGLCGGVVGKNCNQGSGEKGGAEAGPTTKDAPTPAKNSDTNKSNTVVVAVSVTMSVVVLSLLVIVFFVKKRRHVEVEIPTATRSQQGSKKKGINEGVVEVQMSSPALSRKDSNGSTSSSRKSAASSRKSASTKGGGTGGSASGIGDLTIINDSRGSFGMADLMRASAEVLGNGGMGSAYKAIMGNGVAVAVKRMRELNKLEKDGFDAEMRKLASLRHPNILPPLAYHYRKEEKLVVSEYVAKGSLHYLLHGDRGLSHAELTWPIRLKIIKGVTEGLEYLHSQLSTYDLPHGNLKSSNILINLQYEPLLSDFGFNATANPNVATHALFAYKSPEALQNKQLVTVSPKCDIYCLGVVILEILTGKFPSQYLSNTKGGTDIVQWVVSAIGEGREAGLLDPDMVSKSLDAKENMVQLLHVGANCTDPDPNKRPSFKEIMAKIKSLEGEESCVGEQKN